LNTQFLKGIVAAELRSGDKFWLSPQFISEFSYERVNAKVVMKIIVPPILFCKI